MNFLFWNIKNNVSALSLLKQIITEEKIDIVAIAEYDKNKELLMSQITQHNQFKVVIDKAGLSDKVLVFHNAQSSIVSIAGRIHNVTSWKILDTINPNPINAFFCHLPSKLHRDSKEQQDYVIDYMRDVLLLEKELKNERTIICGDFNMNPFEDGMISSKCFHSFMDKQYVLSHPTRTIRRNRYKTFYNPMWELMGTRKNGIAQGSYYYDKCRASEYLWHTFDQIILSHSLINLFDNDKLKFITSGDNYNLLSEKGLIDTKYSDHLPLKFTFNL